MGAQVAFDPGSFYVWRASDGFSIHLSLKVIRQLAGHISCAGNQTRAGNQTTEKQPQERSGILLGRLIETPARATVIEDFRLLASSDSSSEQPECEDTLFAIASRMAETTSGQRALGFFRAQPHGNLQMSKRDLETFHRLFCENGNIALLIRASESGENQAALFYWQNGAHPRDFGFAFTLDAAQLASGHPGWRYPNPFESAQLAASPHSPESPIPPSSITQEPIRWSRLLLTAALVVSGIGTFQLVTNSNHTLAAARSQFEAPTGGPATAEATPYPAPHGDTALGLTITARPGQLEIRWNRESAPIAGAGKGVMRITEAGTTEVVPIDQRQLRDGYVAYTPNSNDVSVRFEVRGKDGGTTSESIRWVGIP